MDNKCYNKDCKDTAYIYDDYVDKTLESCMTHKPMGWRRVKEAAND